MIETDIQIRFADIDMLGHVNNANLQHYFDLGKTDYFQRIIGQPIDRSEQGVIQKATNIVYEAQTRFSEEIVVRTKVEKIGTKSFTMYQEIASKTTGEIKAYCTATVVAFNFMTQVSIEVPQNWKDKINLS